LRQASTIVTDRRLDHRAGTANTKPSHTRRGKPVSAGALGGLCGTAEGRRSTAQEMKPRRQTNSLGGVVVSARRRPEIENVHHPSSRVGRVVAHHSKGTPGFEVGLRPAPWMNPSIPGKAREVQPASFADSVLIDGRLPSICNNSDEGEVSVYELGACHQGRRTWVGTCCRRVFASAATTSSIRAMGRRKWQRVENAPGVADDARTPIRVWDIQGLLPQLRSRATPCRVQTST